MNRFSSILLILVGCLSCKQPIVNTKLQGSIFGTYYRVTYASDINYTKQFDSLFYVINKSMSTYQVNSDISKLNRNETNIVDSHFIKVFNTSKRIFKETQGAFDPTIGALVNAWDFGPEGKIINLDSLKMDSLMVFVGLDKVKIEDNRIIKPEETFIDFNAIAKGYTVDLVSDFLRSKGIENHLVDIGGELRASGINVERGGAWKVGVEDPNFDGTQSINHVVTLENKSMATSGTYRKFKIDEYGNRYAHIINTKTGYPSETNLLSISVIANDCMTADAYATAFKTMGIDRVKMFLKNHPELQVFLIFENEKQELESLSLNGFPKD
ncbi:FAD:protein FMN transferase [Aestuariivivens marinum]|uniref:FAD:protein FMN transferase n=1 Tax=Aestuariivivens marinum TaxID=2913555 RepID=UPI001F5706C7|nr:FAD:protein FMN transferase [Aestuariivivens marinum]